MIFHSAQATIDEVKKLSYDERERLKKEILTCDPHIVFQPAGESSRGDVRKIICPKCGNGSSGKNATPVEVHYKDGKWLYNCFRCGDFHGDLVTIVADDLKLNPKDYDDYTEILAAGAEAIGYNFVSRTSKAATRKPVIVQPQHDTDTKQLPLIKADIADAQAHLEDLPESDRRGLNLETFRHFGCGYLKDWTHPRCRVEGTKTYPTPRIIVPTEGEQNYTAILPPSARTRADKQFWKMHAGTKDTPFNAAALKDAELVIVVEGEIDAMSIWQATKGKVAVVATLGAGSFNILLPLLKRNQKCIVLFDDDGGGQSNAKKIVDTLIKRGYPAVSLTFDAVITPEDKEIICADAKALDANKILMEAGEEFLKDALETIIDVADADLVAVEEDIARNQDSVDSAEAPAQVDDNEDKELNAALDWLKSLDAENFTAFDARNHKHIHYVALAQVNGFDTEAENFFLTIKQAKEKARKRLKDAESGLTAALSVEEKNALSALAEGVLINSIRRTLDRAITAVEKENEAKRALEAKKREQEERKRKRQIAIAIEAEERAETDRTLEALRNQYRAKPTKELADKIRTLILGRVDWKKDRGGNKIAVKPTAANTNLFFQFDPVLDGLFGFDQFRQRDVLLKAPPWRFEVGTPVAKQPCIGAEWNDSDDAQIRHYLRTVYTDFSSEKIIRDAIVKYSNDRAFHEVKDFFNNLPAWDGTPRAETVFIKFLRADDNAYIREVTMNWLLAAVARIFYPGCDYQTALVLHGNQGIGKSYILSQLGGKWYATLTDSVDDPHILDDIQCIWLGEFKEMAGLSKADVKHIKAFIDTPADLRRPAYARRATRFQRHCVFAISTNDETFLSDTTGNRRFNIIHCHSKQGDYVEGLTDDYIQQLWAEVYAKFNEIFAGISDIKLVGKKLELSRETKQTAAEIAEQHLNDDGMQGEIEAFLDTKRPPEIIWNLLSKDERRKFFVDGGKFAIEKADLQARFKNMAGRRYKELESVFNTACTVKDGYVREFSGKDDRWWYAFYGTELREHICAAEVFTECFGNDKRKRMTRIHEILSMLDGWTRGARLRNSDPAYGDQKKVFYR